MAHQRLTRRQSVECNYSINLEIRTVDVGMYRMKNSLRGLVADDIQSISMKALAYNLIER